MSDSGEQPSDQRSLSRLERVDRASNQFERQWRAGRSPRIEEFLDQAPEADRPDLLRELIAVEWTLRREAGEDVDGGEYRGRFTVQTSADDAAIASLDKASRTDWTLESTVNHHAEVESQGVQDGGFSQDAPGKVAAPQRIGKYTVIDTIAVSGQGVIYRAVHPNLPREVIIKVSKTPLDALARQSVIDEARVLCDLEHPNLAHVLDLDFEDGCPFLVLEYVRGRNLHQQKVTQTLTSHEAVSLVHTLAEAMEHAHGRGTIHQDLKPANVVLDEAGEPRIIDFGLARLRSAWVETPDTESMGGTIPYMAPEQAKAYLAVIEGRSERPQLDHRVDIFSLGAILYDLLTGKPPFRYPDQIEGLRAAALCEFDRTALESEQIPGWIREACLKAMQRDPSERYSSSAELAAALAEGQESARDKPAGSRNWPRLIAVVGVLVIVASVVAAVHHWRNGPPRIQFVHHANDGGRSKRMPLFENGNPLYGDGLQVEVAFRSPRHCILFALNPDGGLQPCYPDTPQREGGLHSPQRVMEFHYPPNRSYTFGFTDGVGQQAFFLVFSETTLPSWDEIRSCVDKIDWPPPAAGRWCWGEGAIGFPVLRGTPTQIPGTDIFSQACRTIEALSDNVQLYAVAFPVDPRVESDSARQQN